MWQGCLCYIAFLGAKKCNIGPKKAIFIDVILYKSKSWLGPTPISNANNLVQIEPAPRRGLSAHIVKT